MAPALRCLVPADVAALEAILLANRPAFTDVECRTALDLVREGLSQSADADDPYLFVLAEEDGVVVGYACFGSIPLAEGAYDLYWIVVAPGRQGAGVGRALMQRVEETIAARAGRLIVVETSSREEYLRTHRFYAACGFGLTARNRDFYRPGDDKIVYVKYVASTARE